MEVLMVLDKITQGEEHIDRQRPAVPPEPRYLAERKHKAKLEKAALEKHGAGELSGSVGAKSPPVTFTFAGGSGDDDQVRCFHCVCFKVKTFVIPC